jgi:hypothetical protein
VPVTRPTSRYVLRYRGPGRAPARELAQIEAAVRIVDRAPGMVVVEGSGAGINRLMALLPRWVAAAEATVPVPSTRPRVSRSA